MKKCPNCGRETLRTLDWACQWCGYPLLSNGYKKLEKTYRELQEERGYLPRPEPPELAETEEEPEPEAETEPDYREESAPPVAEPPQIPEAPAPVRNGPMPPAIEAKEPEEAAEEEELSGLPDEPETTAVPEPVTPMPEVSEESPVIELPPPRGVLETEPEDVRTPPEEPEDGEAVPEAEIVAAQEPVREVDTAPDLIEVHVRDLNAMFQSDKAAAGASFTGKKLRITGKVDRVVSTGHLDIYYILLTSDDPKTWNVRCTFGPEHSQELRRLVKGNTVTVQGDFGGYERNILLKNCFLV